MSWRRWRNGFAALLAVGLCGCPRPAEHLTDEQNNAHYRAGKDKLAALDYKGALLSFERAVEDNPRSALAHFELGLLNEQHQNDYAAALYHYQRSLKLRPDAYPADNVRQRLPGCKQELVKADSLALMNPTALREIERLREENVALRRQLAALQAQIAARTNSATARPNLIPAPRAEQVSATRSLGPTASLSSSHLTSPVPTARLRAHTVKSGETPMSIARSYQVRLDILMAANPGLDARRMRIGQTVNIPAH